jgi:sugar porter (SP) family MFS transporter
MAAQGPVSEQFSPYLLAAVGSACLGGLLFGYFTAVISGVLLFVSSAFALNLHEQSMVVSILLIGGMLGTALGGSSCERFGRRFTMLLSATIFIISGITLAFADSYYALLLGRFLGGIAVGLASLASPLYIAEISPPRLRGTLVSCYQLAITLGILISFLVNYWLASENAWRLMCGLGIVPAIAQLFVLFFIADTPAWLLRQGKEAQALQILQKIYFNPLLQQNHLAAIKKAAIPQPSQGATLLSSRNTRLILCIGITLSVFQQITGINTVFYYAPKIFAAAGFTSTASALFATLGVGIINVLATIISVWLLDRAGRRALLLVGSAGMSLALLSLACAFFLQNSNTGTIALVSLMLYVTCFALSLGPVTWVLLSEIFPLKIRSKAMSAAVVANWASNYLVSLVFLDLVAKLTPGGTFLLFAVISVLSFIFVQRWIPETKGKSLEEIEALSAH